ncbi:MULTISPECIES: hypothetical protein [Planktothricoides]|uniref:Uncharacterized protein n=2 Tax=Planktothricoides raciborskii TaxID=132608 RepID=A0AAU8JLL5_9CYAN|nr:MULTISPECIES: hypothetical protein [Planktothricoides]MBD2542654.1 hypothetical protein [Planktothricoides raciborskii FACHB-1370]MBD2581112.1 hypothetical protein [Planktothricoides raciborskii FACHB-1261]
MTSVTEFSPVTSPNRLPPRHPEDRSYSRFRKTNLTALSRGVSYDRSEDDEGTFSKEL